MLASVRELKNFEVPFVFEISYANKSSHTLQAEGHREYDSWVGAIRHAIEKRLVGDSSSSFPALLGNNSTTDSSSIAASRAVQNRLLNADIVKSILEGSPECAECSRPDPEWVSLNLGCLVCIECSGVHRLATVRCAVRDAPIFAVPQCEKDLCPVMLYIHGSV